MLDELRLLWVDKLLGWAVALAPKGHRDTALLNRAVFDYTSATLKARKS